MVPLPNPGPPSAPAVVAWVLVSAALVAPRLPIVPAARLLGVPALCVALGALGAVLGWREAAALVDPDAAAMASVLSRASGAWVHGLLAASAAALVGAFVWAWRGGPANDAMRMPWLVGAALAALLVAQVLGLGLGDVHGWLLVPMVVAHVGIATVGVGMARRRLRSTTIGWPVTAAIGLAWMAASAGLSAEGYRPLAFGGVDPRDLDLLDGAARSLRVTGPGLLAAAVTVAWGAREGERRPGGLRAEWMAGLLAVVAIGACWAVARSVLAPLEAAAAGGRLDRVEAAALPLARGPAGFASASCIAAADVGWALEPRFPPSDSCVDTDARVVAARAETDLAALVRHPWADRATVLEVLVRVHRRPRGGSPLRFADRRAMAFDWVPGPLPTAFDRDDTMRDQLDGWLTERLQGTPAWRGATDNVWIVDTPRGPMILLSGLGVTVEEPAERLRALSELMAPLDQPRLVLAVAGSWTVQEAVDLCVDVQPLVPADVPCTWIAR